jgi:flagellar hook-length control protein FliK
MQALNVELNPGSNLKPVKGSKSSKVSSTAKNVSSKNKKFAEVYEQLLALPPTAVLAGKVQQSSNKKELLSTTPGEETGAVTKKNKTLGNEVNLLSAVLSTQVSNTGKLVKPMEKGTAAEAKVSSSAAKPVNNETIKPTTVDELKLIKAAEQKVGEAVEAKVAGSTAKSVNNETIKPTTVDELKPIKAAEQKVGEAVEAKVAGSTTKPVNNETIKLTVDEVKLIKVAGKKVSEAAEAQDAAGEVNQLQPNINNSQAIMEKPEAGKSIMSKSQIDFIVTNLAGQIKSGASSLEINLQPESLGKIKLMLQMNEGSLSVRIIAHTEETRNLLDSSLQNIKDSLSQLGINLNDMSVDLANQEKHGNQTGSGYREESKPGKLFGESKESYDNIGIREQSSLQSNRLNILA